MLKNALFFEKVGKFAAALRAPPPNALWPPAAGGYAPRPPNCYSHSTNAFIFEHCSNFSASLKLRPIILYLNDG